MKLNKVQSQQKKFKSIEVNYGIGKFTAKLLIKKIGLNANKKIDSINKYQQDIFNILNNQYSGIAI